MENIKEINIKNRRHYFYNAMIYVKHFEPNQIKIDREY